jgi:hypothetical protein
MTDRRFVLKLIVCPIVFAVLLIVAGARGVANAADPRPWLCRDKPVFSADKPVSFVATSKGMRHWRIFFMQFEPGAAHDGFSISSSADIEKGRAQATGQLGAGRFFAVALYMGPEGHWVCPRWAENDDSHRMPGVVTEVCYSDEDEGPCRVSMTVRQAGP